ncbi:peroxisomal acyl-CoA-dehydrogenase [Collybia nuda]|uniref:Peroxisomal acyl-CoA-dehydrogenase n=1 Tax=Collybia nuda TaxID=64659 RepID=A0A9P5YGE2_9AGAR|nr:peroxisomal acyl-CoA-dehydrogenase [Collybia nuda]
MAMKEFTKEDVAKHTKQDDLWIIVDSKVFDLSKFAQMHPGGLSVLLDEEIEAFFSLHRYEVLQRPQYTRLQIGTVKGEKQQIFPRGIGALSNVPYAEPTWLTPGYHTPYYKDNHRAFQKVIRNFVDEILYPDAQALQEKGKKPGSKVLEGFARLNVHAIRLGPGEHLKGRSIMGGSVKPEEVDYFHELIMSQEMSRIHARGYHDGAAGGNMIGLPAIKNFARPEIRDRVLTEVLDGKKMVALAITEAFAGSDVAGTKTFAKKSADGKYWSVTGTKKWITNGTFADYFVTGCRTEKGMVVLLIERGEGVETKHINTSYGPASGTAFVTFDNIKVPVEYTLGPDNGGGLVVILSNFNHERWAMCCSSLGAQRLIVEECLKWTMQRKVFGKPLNSQAVIRARLAAMISRVESAQAWLENITYQMNNMDYKQQSNLLAG